MQRKDKATAEGTGRPPPPRVLLADDHAVFRMGLHRLLVKAGMQVVAEASDGREAFRQALLVRPDLAVLDASMPHLDGIEAARQMWSACLRTRVALLSEDDSDEQVAQCRRAGAVAFIAKGASGAEVLEVLLTVLEDRVKQDGGTARDMLVARGRAPVETVDLSRLTARERQILSLVAQGHSSVGVAAVLEISVRTVETHRQNIMEKLGVHSVVGLTRLALRMGLV